jgi:hypothetical protein
LKATSKQKDILELTLLEFVNSFSLLVVLGSVSTSYFFSKLFQSNLPIIFYWILASTVWVIYTLDHIIDGLSTAAASLSLRHMVHQKYRTFLIAIIAIFIPANIYLAFKFLPSNMLLAGILLACFVFLYLLLIPFLKKLKKLPIKEGLVALGVTCGMCFLPGIAGKLSFHYSYILLLLVFSLINFLNLVTFSLLDHKEDSSSSMQSIVQIYGYEKINTFASRLVVITFFSMGIWLYSFSGPTKIHTVITLMLMLNVLALILMKKEYFAKNNLYRFWGDSIYMIPGLIQLIFIEKLI